MKKCISIGCSAKFSLMCEICLCTSFQTFLRRDFVTFLYLVSFFCHETIFTRCLLHPQPKNCFRKKLKLAHIWCVHSNDLLGAKVSNRASSSVLSVVPMLWESGYEVCVFFAQTKGPFFFPTKYLLIKPRSYA